MIKQYFIEPNDQNVDKQTFRLNLKKKDLQAKNKVSRTMSARGHNVRKKKHS